MRPTREIVLVILTAAAAACLVAAVVGLLTLEIVHPEADTTASLTSLWHVVAAILAGAAGYTLGRSLNGRT